MSPIQIVVDWTRGGTSTNFTGSATLTATALITATGGGAFTGSANLTTTFTAAASNAALPPTRVNHIQTAFNTGGASKSLPSTFDVQNGDLIVIIGYTTWTGMTLATPTWTGTGTVTPRESVVNVSSSRPNIYLWTIDVTATATGRNITVGYTGSQNWGFTATVWRNHQGLGDTAAANGDGTPLVSLNTVANSAVEMGSGDTLAVDGTNRAWRAVNGQAMTEQLYFRDGSQYAVYGGYRIGVADAPATVGAGLTLPDGQGWAGVAAEIAGTPSTAADPTTVAGTVRRWRADSIAQADASAVSSWTALVGGVALAQATGGNQPTYRTSSINGLPAVRFTTDDWMAATITAVSQPVSYMVVLKPNSVATYQTIVHNGVEIQLQVGAGNTWEMWGGSANLRGGTPGTSPVVLTAVADTTDTLYMNGSSAITGDGGSSGATTTFTLGRHPTAGRPLEADVSEIIVGDHAWSASERAILHSYVQDRYGISVSDYIGRSGGGTDNQFGMMVFLDRSQPTVFDQDLAALKETGSTWIRIGLPSNVIGSVSGTTYTPDVAGMTYVATCCQKAKTAGLKVVLVIADTDRDHTLTLSEEQYRTYVSQFFGYVSQRCGEYVDLWQLWNEFSGRDYRNYQPADISVYGARFNLAIAAGRTAVQQYSSAPVCTTPFGYPINATMYNTWVKFHDATQSACDVIGIHGYPETNPTVINLMATYINNLKARYNKPVAILEYGVPMISGYGTPTQVGAAIVNQINAMASTTPLVSTLYQLRDRGPKTSTIGEDVFGIIENDFTKKSYWQAVVNCIAAL